MRKRSTFQCLRTPRQVLATAGRSARVGTRGRRRRRAWPTRGLVTLVLSGLLLSVGALLGTAVPLRDARSPVPQVVPQPHVIVVKDDTLPPVLQRIAQCESRASSLRGTGRSCAAKESPGYGAISN